MNKRKQGPEDTASKMRLALFVMMAGVLGASPTGVFAQQTAATHLPVYKQSHAPIEARVDDLVRRMTLEEKVRELDLYAGAKELVDAHTDDTHAAPTAAFVPAKAQGSSARSGWAASTICIPLRRRPTPFRNGSWPTTGSASRALCRRSAARV